MTQSSIPEKPELNTAKAREQRERRGAGVPWLPSATPGGALFGYSIAGLAASKLGLLGMIGLLIGGTAVVGTIAGRNRQTDMLRAMRRIGPNFAHVRTDAAQGSLPGDGSGAANSLGMFASANRNAIPDGSASADAAGQAQNGTSGDAKVPGAEGAAAGASASADAQEAGSAAPAGPAGTGPPRSGRLVALNPFAAGASGGGSGGGVSAGSAGGANLELPHGSGTDKLQAMSRSGPAVTVRKTAVLPGGANRRGSSLARLDQMSGAMRASTTMGNQQAAATQTAAWEAQTAQGQSDSGSGAGAPQAGSITDGPSADTGAPIIRRPPVNDSAAAAPAVGSSRNVTPWQTSVDIAQALLITASILLMLAALLGLAARHAWIDAATIAPATLYAAAKWLARAALALSVIVSLIGIYLMTQGQMTQGLIFTVVGAVLAGISYVAAEGYKTAGSPESLAAQQAKEFAESDAALQALGKAGTDTAGTMTGANMASGAGAVTGTLGSIGANAAKGTKLG